MANPPGRGKDMTRLQLGQQLAGKEFLIGGVWQTVDEKDVRFHQFREAPDGTATWILTHNGEIMINRNNKKEAFMYQRAREQEQPDMTEAEGVVNMMADEQAEEEREIERRRLSFREESMMRG